MKRVVLMLGFIVVIVSTIHAQDRQGRSQGPRMNPEERAERMTEAMKDKLALSDEQQTAAQQTWTEFFQQMHDLRESQQQERSALRESMQQLAEDRDAEMKEILGADLYSQYETMLEDWKSERGGRKGRRNHN